MPTSSVGLSERGERDEVIWPDGWPERRPTAGGWDDHASQHCFIHDLLTYIYAAERFHGPMVRGRALKPTSITAGGFLAPRHQDTQRGSQIIRG